MSKAVMDEPLALGASMLKHASAERRMEFVQAIMSRGTELYNAGQLDSADVLFETVASEPALRPRVQHIRGLIALQRDEDERALDLLEEAIQLDPRDGEAHANLGLLLLKVRQYPQALAAYAAAVTLRPNNVVAQFGLARAFAKLDLNDFAYLAFRDVLARAPDDIEATIEFGWLLSDTNRDAEGVALLRDALARHPEHGGLRTVLAVCLFGAGDWSSAWAEYEGRLSDPRVNKHLLPTTCRRWRGEDFAGRTILLQSEQGFGDTLQFVRYAPMVKARGGRVVLRAPKALLPLLRTVPGVDDVFDIETTAISFDLHAPLLSLPLIFDTQIATAPAGIPYITPDAERVARWRESLGPHTGFSVGLVWQGNPGHLNDHRRSMRLDDLRPLLDDVGARFVSLQVGAGREQLTEFDDRIIDAGARIDAKSFADAAAIIANLDLVITVDSAVAHLAGAMGKPVWILLPKSSDWRWLKDRDDTPWYPQARLFRQNKAGDWGGVVARLRVALRHFDGAQAPFSSNDAPDPVVAAALRMTVPSRAADPVVCDALFVEACRQQRTGNRDRAKKMFARVIALDPAHVNTLCNLGALELAMGDGASALARLQLAVTLAPELAPARMTLADALLDAKKTEQALVQYQKAVDLAPTRVEPRMAYATALRKLGDAEDTVGMKAEDARLAMHQQFRKALELAPDDSGIHAAYALTLYETGSLDSAMTHFLVAAKINQQQSAEFYEALGRTCAARGNAQGAEISLKHALALDPQRVSAHFALGEFYLSLDRVADADASFSSARALDAESAVAALKIDQMDGAGSCDARA